MRQQISNMTEKVSTVAAAALADGELDGGRRATNAIWATEIGALKSAIKGSLLKLKDGTWAYVGLKRALVEKEAGPVLVVSTGATGKEVNGDWLSANVESALLGVLCVSGAAGQRSKHSYRTLPASIAPHTDGGGFKDLAVIPPSAPASSRCAVSGYSHHPHTVSSSPPFSD